MPTADSAHEKGEMKEEAPTRPSARKLKAHGSHEEAPEKKLGRMPSDESGHDSGLRPKAAPRQTGKKLRPHVSHEDAPEKKVAMSKNRRERV